MAELLTALVAHVDWRAFLVAMALVELTPGPNMGWLAALSAQSGRKVGFAAVAGVTLGLTAQMLAAATGLATLLTSWPAAFETLRWAGIAFMVYLAWRAYVESGENAPASADGVMGFRRGLVANLLNPKALVFYVAVVGQFASAEAGALWPQIVVLGVIHIAVSLLVHSGIVLLGAGAGAALETVRRSHPVRIGFSLSLLAVAGWMAWSALR